MILKNILNLKIILIVGVILAAVIISTAVFLSSNSDGLGNIVTGERLSGTYESYSTYGGTRYIKFSNGNKFELLFGESGNHRDDIRGTYTINGNTITFEYTKEGYSQRPESHSGTINDNRDIIDIPMGTYGYGVYVKK